MTALADLPGLDSARPLLSRLFVDGVQGVFFYGAEGAGQEEAAQLLAQAWLCHTPTPEGPCGLCQPCGAFSRGNNPDFQMVKPWGRSNLLKTGAIREIKKQTKDSEPFEGVPVQDFTRTMPLMSANKVVIFQDVDRLVSEAANSFLKTLEEPGPRVRFILTTHAIGRVMPTILSRCLTVACTKGLQPEGLSLIDQVLYDLPRYRPLAAKPEILRRLVEIVEELPKTPPIGAFQLSERVRDIADGLPLGEDSARTKQAAAIEILTALIRIMHPDRGDWIAEMLEAHRRIVGNAVGGIALDRAFMDMLARSR